MDIAFLNTPVYDYLTATLIEGLKELGHKVYTSENSNYGNFLSRKKFIAFANKSDMFLIGSNIFVKYDYLKYINNKKTIYIDGSDSSLININFTHPINLLFKREYLKNCFLKENLIFPLPFAAEKRYFKNNQIIKDIDISFLATTNNFLRESVKNILNCKYKKHSITDHTKEVSYSSIYGLPQENPIYFDILSRSKVAINIPGYGWDCGRYWEAISNKAFLLTYKLEIEIPNSFEEGKHFMSFSNLSEFDEKISFCINNPEIIEKMTNEAYNHLLNYHTSKKRAEYFLNTIEFNYKENHYFDFKHTNIIKQEKSSNYDYYKFQAIKKIKNWKF